jgi:hypothetical protein
MYDLLAVRLSSHNSLCNATPNMDGMLVLTLPDQYLCGNTRSNTCILLAVRLNNRNLMLVTRSEVLCSLSILRSHHRIQLCNLSYEPSVFIPAKSVQLNAGNVLVVSRTPVWRLWIG